MLDLPEPGLYRTTTAMPGQEEAFPAGALVYVGQKENGGGKFIVRPHQNRNNRWYWREPTTPLRSPTWAKTLKRLPSEGFYSLPRAIEFDGGGKWLENAVVQLGYNEAGKGILFVGEQREAEEVNALFFSDRGLAIEDELLGKLKWAPILPIRAEQND